MVVLFVVYFSAVLIKSVTFVSHILIPNIWFTFITGVHILHLLFLDVKKTATLCPQFFHNFFSFSLGKRDSFISSSTFYSTLLISMSHSFWWRQPSCPLSFLFHYFLAMSILILLWVSWLIHGDWLTSSFLLFILLIFSSHEILIRGQAWLLEEWMNKVWRTILRKGVGCQVPGV